MSDCCGCLQQCLRLFGPRPKKEAEEVLLPIEKDLSITASNARSSTRPRPSKQAPLPSCPVPPVPEPPPDVLPEAAALARSEPDAELAQLPPSAQPLTPGVAPREAATLHPGMPSAETGTHLHAAVPKELSVPQLDVVEPSPSPSRPPAVDVPSSLSGSVLSPSESALQFVTPLVSPLHTPGGSTHGSSGTPGRTPRCSFVDASQHISGRDTSSQHGSSQPASGRATPLQQNDASEPQR